jgi:hypothetical protein
MLYLRRELFAELAQGGKDRVIDALTIALRLEFATIPFYLYSLYSLDRSKNGTIASIIKSVVIEEMLHMALVCNVMNALEQTPAIDDPDCVPTYPGPLPGGIEDRLTVHLERYSLAQLATFLTIEEPETPLNFPVLSADVAQPPLTIGRYYSELKTQIEALSDGDFVRAGRNQVGDDIILNARVVTNVQTALAALDIIIEQGEGTNQSPGEVVGSDYAHFYRFMQISKGRKLIKNSGAGPDAPADQQYIYAGDKITFDAQGVFDIPRDPRASDYQPGSDAREAMDGFNRQYVALLKRLQLGFSGTPTVLDDALHVLMPALGSAARKLASTPAPQGGRLGPSFEYIE